MSKKKSIISLICIVVVLAASIYVVLFGVDADRRGSAEGIKLGLDLAGGVSITYQVAGEEEPDASDMVDTIFKLQKRVENYSTEALVYQEGSDRINIEIPGVSDANAILDELGKPGSLNFYNAAGEEVLSGTDVADARAATSKDDMGNSKYVVALTMTEEGKGKFATATTAAAPTHEIIYIVYDGEVVSAPSVSNAITGGQAEISGMASFEEAERLASTIRIGGLRLELEELRSNVVGAQLGTEAISTSIKAGIIGLIIIIILMLALYRMFGLAASIALTMYVSFIMVLLNGFDITLTLPGIAGIILSVGMAVDANIIIFARIKEEIAGGMSIKGAIDAGFKKALSAILDGNITTLIAAVVLGILGTGSIKGFAQTLALGIVLSMFSALFITKIIMKAFYGMGVQSEKFYGRAREHKVFDFVSRKAVFFSISVIVICAGFVAMFLNSRSSGDALNYSLEFKGGTSTSVTFNEEMSIEKLDSEVVPLVKNVIGSGIIQTQRVQGKNEVIIKTRTLELNEREELNKSLVDKFAINEELITAETISSTISDEMRSNAFLAVIISALCMLIYIWLRFKDLRFGASAVAALMHDILVVLAFYAIIKIPVGNTFIACMLTIIGYSINATIVIFDRIRENMLGKNSKATLKDIVNASISQTLDRSIFTSLTTFIMVALIYFLGVTAIKDFALPLMIGIMSGAFSSICIVGALWYVMKSAPKRDVKK